MQMCSLTRKKIDEIGDECKKKSDELFSLAFDKS